MSKTSYGSLQRFYRDVVLNYEGDECLLWPYATTENGYGQMYRHGKNGHVHRYLCEDVHGAPPTEKHQASHSCGKGHLGCVTKKHLSWKTPADNQADRLHHGTDCRGEKHWNAKLTNDQVREIMSQKGIISQAELGRRFGVSQASISYIHNGNKWKHVA